MDPLTFIRYPQPDIRHFRPSPNLHSPSPPVYHARQSSNPHIDYINLRKNLENQKNSTRINLNDNYIRDEGCKIVSDFLQANTQITQLELKGNNITSKGLIYIIEGLQQNFKIKVLNLEWNNLGLDSSGLEALANFLTKNTSLNHLDLKNNRINASNSNFIANIIKFSKSLISIDLRWNELSNIGGKSILSALKENHFLQVLEMTGNNISEELLQEIAVLLERNRQKTPITLHKRFEESLKECEFSEKEDYGDKENYIKRLEKQLQEERSSKLESQGKIDLEFQKLKANEFELNKIIHDLELKNDKFLSDNRNLRQNLDKLTAELEIARSNTSELSKLQDVKLISFEKELQESEKRHKVILEKLIEENEFHLKSLASDSEERIRSLEEQIKELKSIKQDLENELKRAIEIGAKLKLTQEDQIREMQYKLGEQENIRYVAHLKNLEGRLKVLEENREILNKKNTDLIREIKDTEVKRSDNSINVERQLKEYQIENEGLMEQLKDQGMEMENLRNDLKLKEHLIEKMEHEINDLNGMIENFKNDNKEQFIQLTEEHKEEVRMLQEEKDAFNAKMEEMQNILRNHSGENMRLRHDYQRLADLLQSALSRSVGETFSMNNFI